jgi:hypothetical protein
LPEVIHKILEETLQRPGLYTHPEAEAQVVLRAHTHAEDIHRNAIKVI